MPRKTQSFDIVTDDDVIVTTTTTEARPRVIDYADILDAAEIVPDEDMGPPWENCDGFEHKARRSIGQGESQDYQRRGYCHDSDGRAVLIELTTDDSDDLEFYRERGASRQVAAELVAMDRRRRLDQLVKWYSHGWEWYGVTCEFYGRGDSIWGIDDYEYARTDVLPGIVAEVAGQLEEAGHVIINRPAPPRHLGRRMWTREQQRAMYRRNLNLFNVDPS